MILFLTFLILPAHAGTHTCSLRDIPINQPRLTEYATASGNLKEPRRLRTEANPEFDPDYPTTFWALPTAGATVAVKVHRAIAAPSAGDTAIEVVWVDTMLTIDPRSMSVSGDDECDRLQPVTEHILEILKVIQEPGAPH